MGDTQCSSTVCTVGTTCPFGPNECEGSDQCVPCPPGNVSLGGECSTCDGDGSVANSAQSACLQCRAGTQPNTNRSGCEHCPVGRFSTFGYNCEPCELPSVPKNGRTTCGTCPPGQGPFGGNGSNDWECKPCGVDGVQYMSPDATPETVSTRAGQPTDFSPAGTCLDCQEPYVVSADRLACTPCQAGFGPNHNYNSCVPCEEGTFSTTGIC
eukprot:SAG31_NODE_16498_length_707_cov_0.731908_1_plen_210_part_10